MASSIKTQSPRAARQKQLIPVTELTGGLDLRRSPTLLASNRSRTNRNWSLEEPGALRVRPGFQRASSVVWFSGRPQGGQRVYLANSVFNVLAGDGKVFHPSDAWAGSTAAVVTGLSTMNQVFFPYDRDVVMVMDGAHRPKLSTNGSSWLLSGTDA